MYSFTRVWIGPNEARMLIQVRVVVRTTSAMRQPVDAHLVLDPEQSGSSRPAPRTGTPGPPALKPTSSTSETTHVSSATPSAA